jgi:hypothetical protein
MGREVGPYEGYPKTHPEYDDDGKILTADVLAVALSPFSRFLRDKLRWVVGATAFGLATVDVYQMVIFEWESLIKPFVAFLVGFGIGHWGFGLLLRTNKKFTFNREFFTVWKWGFIPRRFKRTEKLRFVLKPHRWAAREERMIEFFKARRTAKGKGTWMTPYFGESVVLCVHYAKQDLPIMKFAVERKGQLVHGRFSELIEDLNSSVAGGGVRAFNPKAQGKNSIGSLKQDF